MLWEFRDTLSNSVFGNWRRNTILVRPETRHWSIPQNPHHKQNTTTPTHLQNKLQNSNEKALHKLLSANGRTVGTTLLHLNSLNTCKHTSLCSVPLNIAISPALSNTGKVLNVCLKSQEPNQTMNDYNPWPCLH